jgi:hypothetical protein
MRATAFLAAFFLCCQVAFATVTTTHFENSHTPAGETVFAFTFKTLSKDHVKVYLDDVLIAPSNYTVSLLPSNVGGTVTFSVAPVGTELVLRRETPKTQQTAFPLGGKLPTAELENGLDRLTMILQETGSGITGPQGPAGPTGPAGSDGEMSGPGSSTDGAIALFDGTGGATLKDGPAPTGEGNILKVVGGQWVSSGASATLPSGLRCLWGDPAVHPIPTGWEPCDGRTVTINGASYVTPDTRGKYLMCAAEEDTGSSGYTGSTVRPDTVAGAKTHAHSNSGTITVNNTTVTGSVSTSPSGVTAGGGFNAAVHGTYSITTNAHNHAATISGSTFSSSEAARPIEVAQLLIIKVDE